ncbi:signal peptide peptidase SppA [Thalassotalea castellviae]|uniref:Signal peptide peptidase SppA n=1 Tax=Thalassotalea castellviae TaxID=3075612 RepID=A0ABU2ZVU0_9GAMM|nr:signal peptide peptidase SppA [Thalassotalea sp. W431]MDT0602048.1 signal peptide peptidase SppA [Thalassotalea sp. W431]
MNEHPSAIKRISKSLFELLNISRKIIVNLVFFTVLLLLFIVLTADEDEINVPNKAALVLNLKGDIVEQKQEIKPMDAFLNEAFDQPPETPEVLLADIINVIDTAKNDNRIQVLALQLQGMKSAGLTKLRDIAESIEAFKATGKKVIAYGDHFQQDQYYLASYADEIWLNPNGWMMLDGYGRYQLYFKSALEKLSISQHIFRVGTYKSAVEPYMRDDMSPAAKESNKQWLSDLWQQYKLDVASQREFSIDNFDETTDALLEKLQRVDGKIAQYALTNHWVDQLKTRQEITQEMISLVGQNNHNTFNQISFKEYLKATSDPFPAYQNTGDQVALIVAKGTILDGTQSPGTIGGDSTARYLKKARLNSQVKAVVLRVDSPGGSAYASDIIRQEIELIKAAGKPVIASMGTYAASGGYWISAPADKIFASPTTITGSIGIFGFFMTFENSLSQLGIHTDGVGTTEIAGFGVTRPLNDGMAQIFQLGIERGYQDFIELVASNRNMSLEQVDAIAQGRVWSGMRAKELGLVDELGNLDDAINEAANLAKLDSFETLLIEKERSPQDLFFESFFGQAVKILPEQQVRTPNVIDKLLLSIRNEYQALSKLNDPQGIYSFCLACQIN